MMIQKRSAVAVILTGISLLAACNSGKTLDGTWESVRMVSNEDGTATTKDIKKGSFEYSKFSFKGDSVYVYLGPSDHPNVTMQYHFRSDTLWITNMNGGKSPNEVTKLTQDELHVRRWGRRDSIVDVFSRVK